MTISNANTTRNEKLIWFGSILLLFVILIYNLFAEKTVNNGAGYDGVFYRDLVNNFPAVLEKGFNGYKASRIFPFALCYLFLHLLPVQVNDTIILYTVWLMAFVLLMAAVYYYHKLAVLCNWSFPIKITGFILLFYHFGILKFMGFYPILTDHFIFSISIISIYYFLKKNVPDLIILGLVASFTWPSSLVIYLLLLLNSKVDTEKPVVVSKLQSTFFELLKIGFAFIPAVLFVYFIRRYNLWVNRSFLTADWIYAMFRPFNFAVAVLSIISTASSI